MSADNKLYPGTETETQSQTTLVIKCISEIGSNSMQKMGTSTTILMQSVATAAQQLSSYGVYIVFTLPCQSSALTIYLPLPVSNV